MGNQKALVVENLGKRGRNVFGVQKSQVLIKRTSLLHLPAPSLFKTSGL